MKVRTQAVLLDCPACQRSCIVFVDVGFDGWGLRLSNAHTLAETHAPECPARGCLPAKGRS